MDSPDFISVVEQSINELLVWVGFGTLVGLAAKAAMPGRDPGGAVATMLMGIGGSVIGCGVVLFFWRDAEIDPISGKGFVAATIGAFTLLAFYRLLAGTFFAEGNDYDNQLAHRARRRRRRRRIVEDVI